MKTSRSNVTAPRQDRRRVAATVSSVTEVNIASTVYCRCDSLKITSQLPLTALTPCARH